MLPILKPVTLPLTRAAGNHLFDVLVENEEVAGRLIRGLHQNNLGRATFVPLNRVGDMPEPPPPTE